MAPRSSSNGSGTASERPRGGDVEGASKCERHACDVGGILTRQDIRRCIGDLRRLAIAHHGEHAVSPSSRGSTSPRINGVDAKHQVAPTSPAMDQMLTTYPRPSVHMAGMTACIRRGAIWWTSSACPTHWRRILARIPRVVHEGVGAERELRARDEGLPDQGARRVRGDEGCARPACLSQRLGSRCAVVRNNHAGARPSTKRRTRDSPCLGRRLCRSRSAQKRSICSRLHLAPSCGATSARPTSPHPK